MKCGGTQETRRDEIHFKEEEKLEKPTKNVPRNTLKAPRGNIKYQ